MEDLATASTVLSRWYRHNEATHPNAAGFSQIDIDELLGYLPERPNEFALRIFDASISQVSCISLLTFPLPDTDSLDFSGPNFHEVLKAPRDELLVPGFYILDEWLLASVEDVEEYRRPVSLSALGLKSDLTCYYRAYFDGCGAQAFYIRRANWPRTTYQSQQ